MTGTKSTRWRNKNSGIRQPHDMTCTGANHGWPTFASYLSLAQLFAFVLAGPRSTSQGARTVRMLRSKVGTNCYLAMAGQVLPVSGADSPSQRRPHVHRADGHQEVSAELASAPGALLYTPPKPTARKRKRLRIQFLSQVRVDRCACHACRWQRSIAMTSICDSLGLSKSFRL